MVSLGVAVLPSTEVLECGDELGFLGEARSESTVQTCEDVVLLQMISHVLLYMIVCVCVCVYVCV